jgi:hypothetical protein
MAKPGPLGSPQIAAVGSVTDGLAARARPQLPGPARETAVWSGLNEERSATGSAAPPAASACESDHSPGEN